MVRHPTVDHPAQNEDQMTRIFQAASMAAVGLTALTAVALTAPGLAQSVPGDTMFEPVTAVSTAPSEAVSDQAVVEMPVSEPVISPASEPIAPRSHGSLGAMVAAVDHREPESDELRCVAIGVYYESRSESLEGQLAVAHVILNRASSGRFASTPCGVLTQRGQFSFVRGGVVPTPAAGAQWRTAVAIARIASDEAWHNPAPGAMFFHATHVSPGWSRPRVARLGNHIFYR